MDIRTAPLTEPVKTEKRNLKEGKPELESRREKLSETEKNILRNEKMKTDRNVIRLHFFNVTVTMFSL